MYTFLDILIDTLTRLAPPEILEVYATNARLYWPIDAESFLSRTLARGRYCYFAPHNRSDHVELKGASCWRSSRLRDKSALSHFRTSSVMFARSIWGHHGGEIQGKELCGIGPMHPGTLWINVANMAEELLLFAVETPDALVYVLSECFQPPTPS